MRKAPDCLIRLVDAGIGINDAYDLRRIAMTLHRWHELECGDGNDYASWCITRGHFDTRECKFWDGNGTRPRPTFVHDDNGAPYLERHAHNENKARYTKIADRERGALKRLGKIMAKYPEFKHFVQGDPRGASLYIMRAEDANYTDGIAVYR